MVDMDENNPKHWNSQVLVVPDVFHFDLHVDFASSNHALEKNRVLLVSPTRFSLGIDATVNLVVRSSLVVHVPSTEVSYMLQYCTLNTVQIYST